MAWSDFLKRGRLGRRRQEPRRDTIVWPSLVQNGNTASNKRIAYKPTPRNLRWFGKTPYARRAINAIKNPISMLEWKITTMPGVEMNAELERQAELATYCFDHPNGDDSFRSFSEQVVEDILLGAGAIEAQMSGDELRPLWMWPVDGLTIQIFPAWSGAPREPRYVQIVGYGNFVGNGVGQQIMLTDEELIYLRPNPSSCSPFGAGPLEVAFNSVSRILGVGEFAGNVASNARPSIALDLGEGAGPEVISAFRQYWRNDVEGQGSMPIWGMEKVGADGKARGPNVLRLYPEGDAGLYLKYQEFLKSEIAIAFDLSPQNLGVERDVNRNTAEVAEDRDRNQAIKPMAHLFEQHLTRHAVHRLLGFSQLRFQFEGIEQEDEEALAKTYELEYRNNSVTPNEYRARRGMEPSDNPFADMLNADVQIAMQAARGAAQVDDPDLRANPDPGIKPKSKSKRKD